MDLSKWAVDPQAALEGRWFDLGREKPSEPMARIKVARMNNQRYVEKRAELMRALIEERGGDEEAVKREDMDDLLVKSMAHAILIDWENLELFGEPLGPWSEEKCIEVLGDPRLVDFRNTVAIMAQERENFRIKQMEETTGKS